MQPSFWQRHCIPANGSGASLDWRPRCDVAVVGGGLTGLSAAYWLAREGAAVCLLERRCTLAAGATGRSAGQINPIGPALPDQLAGSLGTRAAQDYFRMLWNSKALLEQIIAEEGISCGLRRVPLHHLARGRIEWARLQDAAPHYERLGRQPQLLAPQGTFLGGISLPGHLQLDPWRLARGLAECVTRRGCAIYTDVDLRGVTPVADGSLRLDTDRGLLRCEFVIHARGHATTHAAVYPVRGQMLWTDPLPRVTEANYISNGGYDYWQQHTEGQLLIGGMRYLEPEMECGLTDRTLNPKIQDGLLRLLRLAYPTLGPLAAAGGWCGIMAHTGDSLPLVGSLPGHPRQLVAGGMCGQGLAYGMATGKALAARILGQTTDYPWALFSPRRFL